MGSLPTSARSRMRTSPLGGVPTVLADPAPAPVGQLALGLDPPALGGPDASWPLPGVARVRNWLSAAEQRALADQFRSWAGAPAGLRHPRVPAGHVMTVQSVCLGWHWQPYAYSRTADDTDGAPVKPMPSALFDLACRAVADVRALGLGVAGDDGMTEVLGAGGHLDDGHVFHPDAAIVNLYEPGAKLGLHQDGEEPSTAPVVTISLGDTGVFRFAGVDRRTAPFTDLALHSGDLLVFGGVNRRIFHGVTKVLPGSGPEGLGLPPGRVSITVRETGLV